MAEVTEDAEILLVENRGAIRLLTLNRPHRLNAFNDELVVRLGQAIAAAAADDTVSVVVLTGSGKGFSSGADLSGMARSGEQTDAQRKGAGKAFADLQSAAESFPKPLIAAVNGLGVGLGFTILGYCDFVYAGQSARLRTPFSQLGLSPEASSSYTFPLRMGWSEAARALMLGDWFSAQDLVDCGMARAVVPDADLMAVTLEFAERLAACPLQSLMATKQLMVRAHLDHLRTAREHEMATMSMLIGTPANKAAVAAFLNRSQADKKGGSSQ